MSNFFRYMFTAFMLLAAVTSCMKEEYHSRHSKEVVFVADLDGIQTRAIADGQTVNEVAWAIYVDGATAPLDDLWGTMPISGKQAELKVRLTTGKVYDLVFFAYYTENPAPETVVNGDINPLYYKVFFNEKKVCVDYSNAIANDEKRDCFWHTEHNIKVDGPLNKKFILKRPLAQLNVGVNKRDIDLADESGYRISASSITVDSYTQFNLFDGSLSELEPITVHFAKNQTPAYSDNTLTVNGDPIIYKYLATTYVLVDDKCTSNVKLSLYDNTDYEINSFTYSFVPLQRNYRTNILGSLLTNPHLFTIVVDKEFEDDHIH